MPVSNSAVIYLLRIMERVRQDRDEVRQRPTEGIKFTQISAKEKSIFDWPLLYMGIVYY